MSTHPPETLTGLGTRESPYDLLSPIESDGSVPNPPSEFSAWASDIVRVRTPLQAAGSVPIAGPSNQPPVGDHNREGSNQGGGPESDQNNDDEMEQDGGDLGQQLDQEGAAINELRRKINSSIVVGGNMALNARQRSNRMELFDLEMSDAKGGMIFDYDDSNMIVGLLCRIHDSRHIQGEQGATLIVAPSEGKIERWITKARDLSNRFLGDQILVYHGRCRRRDQDFDQYKIVITTYRTLSGDLGYHNGGLLQRGIEFRRLILDGGEVIRNQRTQQSKACRKVNAEYHWCCSQNSRVIAAHQYGAFAEFLRIPNLNAGRRRKQFLQRFILGPDDDEAVAAPITSELEDRTLKFVEVDFDQDQREIYRAFEERLNEVGGHYLRPRSLRNGGAYTVCRMLLFSIIACCHLQFVFRCMDHSGGIRLCNMCKERLDPGSEDPFCAVCRAKVISKFPEDPSDLTDPKIEKMIQILHRRKNIPERTGKTAIICQFPAFADLIAQHLTEERIQFVSFYDSNDNEKAAAMGSIRREQDITVALTTINPVTTRGLDLRPFDTVFLMDLWWNPRLDAAAFEVDHDVRVKIYKLYFKDSVESRILELLNRPRLADDFDQDVFYRLGVYSTPDNLDYVLKPT